MTPTAKIHHLLLIVLSCFPVLFCSAQLGKRPSRIPLERVNEVKANPLRLLFGSGIEVSYERILGTNHSVGAYFLSNQLFEESNLNRRIELSPFIRAYFNGRNEFNASGIFIQGFGTFFSAEEPDPLTFGPILTKETKGFNLGIGVGKKWVNHSGLTFETDIGVSRNLFGDSGDEIFLRSSFLIGYRF